MIAEMNQFAVFIGEIREKARKTDSSGSEILFVSDSDRPGKIFGLRPAGCAHRGVRLRPPRPPNTMLKKERGAFDFQFPGSFWVAGQHQFWSNELFVLSTLYLGGRGGPFC